MLELKMEKRFNSKRKGASFEREIAKKLSLWISNSENEDLFWRSAMSGGRATVAKKSDKTLASQAGDLSAIHELGMPFIDSFYVEIKHYKSLDLGSIFLEKGKFVQFWNTARTEATYYKKFPLLIAKQNKLPILICTNSNGVNKLTMPLFDAVIISFKLDMFIYLFNNFLKEAVFNKGENK